MVAGLEKRHSTGKTLIPLFIPGPNSHWELIAIKATGPTHELAVIGPLGASHARTRLPQAQRLAVWLQIQYTGRTAATWPEPEFCEILCENVYISSALKCAKMPFFFRRAPHNFCGSGGVLVRLRERILVSPKILFSFIVG